MKITITHFPDINTEVEVSITEENSFYVVDFNQDVYGGKKFTYNHSVPSYNGTEYNAYHSPNKIELRISDEDKNRLEVFWNRFGQYGLRDESVNECIGYKPEQRLIDHCNQAGLHKFAKSLLSDKWQTYSQLKKKWQEADTTDIDPIQLHHDFPYGIFDDLVQAELISKYLYSCAIVDENRAINENYFSLKNTAPIPNLDTARLKFFIETKRIKIHNAAQILGMVMSLNPQPLYHFYEGGKFKAIQPTKPINMALNGHLSELQYPLYFHRILHKIHVVFYIDNERHCIDISGTDISPMATRQANFGFDTSWLWQNKGDSYRE